ncbi:TlpA family protein disulfide reductase [Vicingaceae bacterium]|jgi:cytochrome c biogenesis protein CcmG, thiol:disulfide interchange protein DsbE|nr:TlpA family protein disulfide reductase [Vicingaceae bacterium]
MKKLILLSALALFSLTVFSQTENRQMPSVTVTDMEGGKVNTSDFNNDGKPMIVNFWATWCSPCKRELNNIADVYEDWVEETGVKLIAISIDDARNAGKVAPYVNGKGWEYEVYIDSNQDLKRALNVNNVPHTFLLNGKGEIVWQHNSYSEGDEDTLYEAVKALAAGKDIKH